MQPNLADNRFFGVFAFVEHRQKRNLRHSLRDYGYPRSPSRFGFYAVAF
jgi:hypothetical protein